MPWQVRGAAHHPNSRLYTIDDARRLPEPYAQIPDLKARHAGARRGVPPQQPPVHGGRAAHRGRSAARAPGRAARLRGGDARGPRRPGAPLLPWTLPLKPLTMCMQCTNGVAQLRLQRPARRLLQPWSTCIAYAAGTIRACTATQIVLQQPLLLLCSAPSATVLQASSRSAGGSAARSGASAGRSGVSHKRDAEALSAPAGPTNPATNPTLGARPGSGSGPSREPGDAPPAKRLASSSTLGRPGGSGSPVTYPQWPSLDDDGGGGSAGGSAPAQRSSAGGGSAGPGASGAAASAAAGADTGGGSRGGAAEGAGGGAGAGAGRGPDEPAGEDAGGAADEQGGDPGPAPTEPSGEGPSGAAADAAPYVQESEVAFMRALVARPAYPIPQYVPILK